MNKDEYIIINKTTLEKRIEELQSYKDEPEITQLKVYKEILHQSTPLIPEIEKAYEAGKLDNELSLYFDNPKDRFLSTLKLDI